MRLISRRSEHFAFDGVSLLPPPLPPSLSCEGNHEGANGFAQYSNRFAVFASDNTSAPANIKSLSPTPWNNHWYSYNIGPVHFVAMSTEAYFFYAGAAAQFAWMDADLSAVNRTQTPWVIVYGHRSIYCSCDSDCDSAATTVREGPYGLEELFKKHSIDLWINGHEHNYEVSVPPLLSACGIKCIPYNPLAMPPKTAHSAITPFTSRRS